MKDDIFPSKSLMKSITGYFTYDFFFLSPKALLNNSDKAPRTLSWFNTCFCVFSSWVLWVYQSSCLHPHCCVPVNPSDGLKSAYSQYNLTNPTGPNEWQWSAAVRWSIAPLTKELGMTDICPRTVTDCPACVVLRRVDRYI